MEIAEDGAVTEDELSDFMSIQKNLDKISTTVETLKLWMAEALDTTDLK